MIDIVQKVIEAKAKKIKMWPINSNRASEMGHPCDRYLVYLRTRGMDRPLHDIGLQFIFDEGNIHEDAVLKDLHEAGLKVIEQQRSFEWKEYQITGSIDAKILVDDQTIPIEIKSFSDWSWKAINSIEDMFKSKALYMKRYPAQLMLYELMDNKELGTFILKNKTSGMLKQIDVPLDFNYAESLIKKAERVNAHVKENTIPDRILYDDNICGVCSFSHICLPDVTHTATLLDDPEFEVMLDRRGQLKEAVSEYDKLDKTIREKVKDKAELVCGNWLIKGKYVEKKAYSVPASTYWQTTIKEIKK